MKVIKPEAKIIAYTVGMLNTIESAGRVCYKSEDKICEGSDVKLIEHLKGMHHESVLEHGAITVSIICDRGISHELVRHRLASFSQESTRYCNYSKGKFDGSIKVIDIATGFKYDVNNDTDMAKYTVWLSAMHQAESHYMKLIELGATAQEARSVLPNSLKTEIVITANPREWRHIFKMRTAPSAHPQMREIMIPLLEQFASLWPVLFEDLKWTT